MGHSFIHRGSGAPVADCYDAIASASGGRCKLGSAHQHTHALMAEAAQVKLVSKVGYEAVVVATIFQHSEYIHVEALVFGRGGRKHRQQLAAIGARHHVWTGERAEQQNCAQRHGREAQKNSVKSGGSGGGIEGTLFLSRGGQRVCQRKPAGVHETVMQRGPVKHFGVRHKRD